MMRVRRNFVRRLAKAGLPASLAIALAGQAHALVIDPLFESSITGASDSTQIENAIDSAVGAIDQLYSNPGTVSILFTTQQLSGGAIGESDTAYYGVGYGSGSNPGALSGYVGLLDYDSLTHPGNATLATAVAHLSAGNDVNGSSGISVTSALLRVGLGDAAAAPCFNTSGGLASNAGGCTGTVDGVVMLSPGLDFSRPNTGGDDAIRVVEHEVDEILGGGGGGSTLNAVAQCASLGSKCLSEDVSAFIRAQYFGPLDLYRYQCGTTTPSFTTAGGASACLSVDGGLTDVVGFNQESTGDYGDFLSSAGCPLPGTENDVQDAFTCAGQIADETPGSAANAMMLAIGWDPVAAPEPATLALLGLGIAGMLAARQRSHRFPAASALKRPSTAG